jgi:hypothetical protein
VRGATQIPNSPLRIAAAQSDDARKEAREGAGPREAVVVHTESQVTVCAAGIGGENPAVDVAHGFRVFGGAVAVPLLLTLPRPVAERRRQPEILDTPRGPRRGTRAHERGPEQ